MVGHKKPKNSLELSHSSRADDKADVRSRLGPALIITSTTVKSGTLEVTPERPQRKKQEESSSDGTSKWHVLMDRTMIELKELRPHVERFLTLSKRADVLWERVKDEDRKRKRDE